MLEARADELPGRRRRLPAADRRRLQGQRGVHGGAGAVGRRQDRRRKGSTSSSAIAIPTTRRRAATTRGSSASTIGRSNTLLFRAMQQRAARAPNVDELASPAVIGLDNATRGSVLDRECREHRRRTAAARLCISTGMSAAQVGTVENIVAGQVNIFEGTDLANLPTIEQADTTTVGLRLDARPRRAAEPGVLARLLQHRHRQPDRRLRAAGVLDACYSSRFSRVREGRPRRRHADARRRGRRAPDAEQGLLASRGHRARVLRSASTSAWAT